MIGDHSKKIDELECRLNGMESMLEDLKGSLKEITNSFAHKEDKDTIDISDDDKGDRMVSYFQGNKITSPPLALSFLITFLVQVST